MQSTIPFARLTYLMKAIDDLPFPFRSYTQHRIQYDYILGQICLSSAAGKLLNVSDFLGCPTLGSQPTANKRIKELIDLGLIETHIGEDRRQKFLLLTSVGKQYLEKCSELMLKCIA